VETEDVLLYAGLAVAGYLIYKRIFEAPLTQEQGDTLVQNAGLARQQNTFTPATTSFQTSTDIWGNTTTFRFANGDYSSLNAAQRILIGLDRVVPGSWLTRAVLS
jgi:hypothetical protein